MFAKYRKIRDLLNHSERRRALLLFGMMVVMGLLEVVSVSLILPFMDILSNPESIENRWYLNYFFQLLGFEDSHSFLVFFAIMLLVSILGSITFRAITTLAIMRFSHMNIFALSQRLLRGYLHQPYTWFLDRHSADLGKTVLTEITHVVNTSLIPALQLIARTILALFLICLLMLVNPIIALTSAIGLGGAYAIISYAVRNYAYRTSSGRMKANREQFQIAQEALVGIKDVKIFGIEEILIERFCKPARHFASSNANITTIAQVPKFALEGIAFGGMLLIILVLLDTEGGHSGAIPVITLFAFTAYRLLPALQGIYHNYTMIRYGKTALDALHRDLVDIADHLEKHVTFSDSDQERRPLCSVLELRNICYSYPHAKRSTLTNLSLKIPANSTVALVGGSGAGKTTIADIILGLLIPEDGELLVDGEIVTAAKIRAWQQSIGYVPQQIFLMDDTIAGNIAFGISKPDQKMVDIERASIAAGLHQFIKQELPDGYQTMVGEGGVKLSGGQRQRIGIARALYRNPDVLIMDEATNALDSLTEQAVMDAIHNLAHTKTVILIAHRFSTVRNCDQVFFIVSGSLQHQGTFQTLIEESEEFAKLANAGLMQ